jgi:hypothetical protein
MSSDDALKNPEPEPSAGQNAPRARTIADIQRELEAHHHKFMQELGRLIEMMAAERAEMAASVKERNPPLEAFSGIPDTDPQRVQSNVGSSE